MHTRKTFDDILQVWHSHLVNNKKIHRKQAVLQFGHPCMKQNFSKLLPKLCSQVSNNTHSTVLSEMDDNYWAIILLNVSSEFGASSKQCSTKHEMYPDWQALKKKWLELSFVCQRELNFYQFFFHRLSRNLTRKRRDKNWKKCGKNMELVKTSDRIKKNCRMCIYFLSYLWLECKVRTFL